MPRRTPPEALGLGPLEAEVMTVLWRRRPSRVAEVVTVLNRKRTEPLAYTTVLSVLSNLEEKGVVGHTVEGRAHRFSATVTEAELRERRVKERARDLFAEFADEAVSAIVGEVHADPALEERFRRLLDRPDAPDPG